MNESVSHKAVEFLTVWNIVSLLLICFVYSRICDCTVEYLY